MSFYTLPDEILLIIFNYCDTYDLIRLNGVCKRFYHITSELLNKISIHLLVTGQMSEKFRQRCHTLLSYKLKFSTYNNWACGICVKKILSRKDYSYYYFQRNKSELLLHMTKDTIWLKDKKSTCLCAFNRTKYGFFDDSLVLEECNPRIHDIVPCNDVIITNHFDGSIKQWTIESLDGRKYFDKKVLKKPIGNGFIYDVMDVTPRHIILGLCNGEIKIWKYLREENAITDENVISKCNLNLNLNDELKSIAFDPTGTKFAAGMLANYFSSVSCIIYDINKCYTETDKKCDVEFFTDYDAFFNRLFWENPNTILLTGSFQIKKVDVRTHKVAHTWKPPTDSNLPFLKDVFTCVSSDNQYAIMTGTLNGKVILWDQRKSDFVQVYDVPNIIPTHSWKNRVQSLQFDSSYMYILADRLYELDFTHTARNIRNIL